MRQRLPIATLPALRGAGRRAWGRAAGLAAAVPLLALTVACGSSGGAVTVAAPQPTSQMEFGVTMAQRGLWSEALFRFQQADRESPGDPKVLNNLAVAYEATGQYDKALASYKEALQVAPENRDLRRNYARFVEFYQSFRPQEETPEAAGGNAAAGAGAPADR